MHACVFECVFLSLYSYLPIPILGVHAHVRAFAQVKLERECKDLEDALMRNTEALRRSLTLAQVM
jgi:hypothetical protein